jgi:hypothetical protein
MSASTERQVLGKFVMPLNFGRPLVNRTAQGLIHDPFQQIRSSNCLAKFLQGQSESIFRAGAIDPSQNRRGCERSPQDANKGTYLGPVLAPALALKASEVVKVRHRNCQHS